MSSEIIVALITLVGSAAGTLGGVLINSKLTNYRLEQLENKVNKHNNIIERTFKLEEQEALLNEKIAVVNHRINDLEAYHK